MIDLSNADYHAHPAVSKSHLDQVARSPLHYWCRYLDPDRVPPTPTPALVLGSAVHTAVLEPHLWQAEYAVAPEGIERRTKAGKDAWAEFEASSQGKTLLRAEDAAQTLRMADAVHSHPAARLILEQEGLAEASYFWTDEATGEECKCRPDWHSADRRLIVDLKTTEDASPETFQRSVHKWRYHVQTAWYLRGLGADQFVFIAVEKQEPHLVAVYVATPDMVAAGGRVADRDLALLSECRKLNEWPGYSDEIIPIDLPRYAND
jgi:exodeoxyribonuclease VIII